MPLTYYEVLGVSETASAKGIKEAYRRLIFEHHPDRNKDPNAQNKAASINEAYNTLSDDSKRALYNEKLKLLRSTSQQTTTEESGQRSAEPRPVPDYKCDRCGCRDTSIRMTLFHSVVSMIFVTNRSGKAGIWCSRCRAFESAKYTFLSGLFGWWGFPWGPIYTIGALFNNARGGEQPKRENATILSILAYRKYQEGNFKEAYWALKESLRLYPNNELSPLLKHLKSMQPVEKPFDLWEIAAAAPAVIVSIVLAGLIYRTANAPSGYEARYTPPVSSASVVVSPSSAVKEDPSRKRVNALVNQLADIVERRSPVTGTIHRGNKIIRQHVLDRSKFDAGELNGIANLIYAELKNSPDPDGFMASSFFNAKILALSIDIINSIENGGPIDASANVVIRLGKDEQIARWLDSSQFRYKYQDLRGKLSRYRKQYTPGKSLHAMEAEWSDLDRQCKEMRSQLDEFKMIGDQDAFNGMVDVYNKTAKRTNNYAHHLQFRATAQKKLDLAFNRCLDVNIIMSKFSEVNLTSHASDIDAIPDPK